MLKNRILLICVGCILFNTMMFCQNLYESGYVIKNNGDTIRGFLDVGFGNSKYQQCTIIVRDLGDTIVYYPDDIKEFRFGKRSYYATRVIQIDSVPTKLFVKCVAEGLACLFHTKQGLQEYYILERNGNSYNLSNDAKIVKYNPGSIAESRSFGGGDDFVQHSNQYIGMLSIAFSDCPQLKKEINNLDFSLQQLVKITRKYNTIMTPQVKSPH